MTMMENGRTDNGFYAETDIIETTDEEGTVHVFEKISELEIEGQDYALLIYKGNAQDEEAEAEAKDEDEEEVVVMRISYEDGQEVFEAIEDEEEFERVVAYIESLEEDEDDDVSIDVSDFISQIKSEDADQEHNN